MKRVFYDRMKPLLVGAFAFLLTLTYLLTMLRDEGEAATFHYLRNSVLKGKPFPWEQTEE